MITTLALSISVFHSVSTGNEDISDYGRKNGIGQIALVWEMPILAHLSNRSCEMPSENNQRI